MSSAGDNIRVSNSNRRRKMTKTMDNRDHMEYKDEMFKIDNKTRNIQDRYTRLSTKSLSIRKHSENNDLV